MIITSQDREALLHEINRLKTTLASVTKHLVRYVNHYGEFDDEMIGPVEDRALRVLLDHGYKLNDILPDDMKRAGEE